VGNKTVYGEKYYFLTLNNIFEMDNFLFNLSTVNAFTDCCGVTSPHSFLRYVG